MQINKEDLVFSDYRWNALPVDDPKITGKPDSTRFNRHEGYEMLYFINKMDELYKMIATKADAKKLEYMLHEELPSTIINQEDVQDWVEENWE